MDISEEFYSSVLMMLGVEVNREPIDDTIDSKDPRRVGMWVVAIAQEFIVLRLGAP